MTNSGAPNKEAEKYKTSTQEKQTEFETQAFLARQESQTNEMRKLNGSLGFDPKKVESAAPRKGLVVVYLLVVLVMGFASASDGRFIVTPTMRKARDVPALYILGDSSVDCGENTLFYPLLHRNLSLYPCNGSDASLIPHLLGINLLTHFSLSVIIIHGFLCLLMLHAVS